MSKPLTTQAREAAARVAKHSNIWEIVLLGDALTTLAIRHGIRDEASELIAKFAAAHTPEGVA